MADERIDPVPIASAAAWSPDAAPAPRHESKVLTLDDAMLASLGMAPATPPAPALPVRPTVDRLSALRDIARKLRSAPDADETLQYVIDTACECTGSTAGMLTLQAPNARQFVSGTALGAGPYISVPLRVGGPSFGELVLTRLSEAEEYLSEDETFGDLVGEYVAKAVAALRRGTVLSQEEQDFIDRITEELRAPLASIVNLQGVVLGGEAGELPADAQRYLTTATHDCQRLLNTVDDLLNLAHLRPPELREMETVAIGPWLARAVERQQARARDRNVALTYREAPQPYLIQAKPAQLEIAVMQLLDNALKFTEGGGRVDVTAGLAEGLLRISVRDTGIGFDNSEANRMTDCFARAITAEAARIPGLGIGLFLANQITINHGGRLWLESRRDEGTQAHIALPLRAE